MKHAQTCRHKEQTCGCQGEGNWRKDERVGGWREQMDAIIQDEVK